MNKSLNQVDVRVAEATNQHVGDVIFSRLVDTLNNEERKALRDALQARGLKTLPQNLFFNYETQEWI